MIELENETLKVALHRKGAEIHQIIGQQDHINYMWKRDPELWDSSAPILFPIVGALRNGECRINGKIYAMTQHGFSRHNEYTVIQQTKESVTFNLQSNEAIQKEQYPYLFDLNVTYSLKNNQLICDIDVKNIDQDVIYFQVGGHPAFSCPFQDGEDVNSYYLEFEKNETLERKHLDVKNKGMSHITEPFFDHERRFFIRQRLFDNDAIIFKDIKSETISLKSIENNKSIKFYLHHFNHVGLWASKHVGGLIAIEPWVGHIDYVDFTGEFKDKEGVVKLQPQENFQCQFVIEINQ